MNWWPTGNDCVEVKRAKVYTLAALSAAFTVVLGSLLYYLYLVDC